MDVCCGVDVICWLMMEMGMLLLFGVGVVGLFVGWGV